jgi:hypothetical protein
LRGKYIHFLKKFYHFYIYLHVLHQLFKDTLLYFIQLLKL